MSDWKVVETYSNRAFAEMMLELLENQSIRAALRGDDGGGVRPELALTQGIKLEVFEEDLARAQEVLDAYGGGEDDEEGDESAEE